MRQGRLDGDFRRSPAILFNYGESGYDMLLTMIRQIKVSSDRFRSVFIVFLYRREGVLGIGRSSRLHVTPIYKKNKSLIMCINWKAVSSVCQSVSRQRTLPR